MKTLEDVGYGLLYLVLLVALIPATIVVVERTLYRWDERQKKGSLGDMLLSIGSSLLAMSSAVLTGLAAVLLGLIGSILHRPSLGLIVGILVLVLIMVIFIPIYYLRFYKGSYVAFNVVMITGGSWFIVYYGIVKDSSNIVANKLATQPFHQALHTYSVNLNSFVMALLAAGLVLAFQAPSKGERLRRPQACRTIKKDYLCGLPRCMCSILWRVNFSKRLCLQALKVVRGGIRWGYMELERLRQCLLVAEGYVGDWLQKVQY